jgi:hypothetical protein
MSADPEAPDPGYTPKDHRKPLSQREVFEFYLRDLEARPLVFTALGSLAMIFLVMFLNGSDIGAVLVALLALASIALRWIAGPPILLVVIFYFQLFPFGIPDLGFENPFEVRETHFRVVDVILVLAVLVHLRSAYRLFGLVQQSMPSESVFRRKGEHPTRRPTSHITPNEIAILIAVSGALVIIGQLAWWLVNALEFTPADDEFPLRWADTADLSRYRRSNRVPGEFRPGANRFFIIVGALFFGLLLVRLLFGYWKLRMMNAAEGAMVLTDTSWSESHRERVRVEKWRMWGLQKAAARAKEEARAERERREKEARKRDREEDEARRAAREQEKERERARRRNRDEDDDEPPRRRRDRD